MSEPALAALIGGLTISDPAIAAFFGALTAGTFSILGIFLIRRKEERARRREASLRHIQRQIEELYGPLLGYLQTTQVIHKIVMQRLAGPDRSINFKELSEEDKKLWLYLNGSYLLPTNAKIAALLRDKSYLVDEIDAPEEFQRFPIHALQYELVNTIWNNTGVDTSFLDHLRFPTGIEEKTTTKLRALRGRYLELISLQEGK